MHVYYVVTIWGISINYLTHRLSPKLDSITTFGQDSLSLCSRLQIIYLLLRLFNLLLCVLMQLHIAPEKHLVPGFVRVYTNKVYYYYHNKHAWNTRAHFVLKVWLFISTYWSQPTCLPLCSDAELILRDWKYWFDSVSYFVEEEGGSSPSWLFAPCSHIGLATQLVPQETHNYSRPFRLVRQPVQLWIHSLVIYFIPFPLLRGTPQHIDQAGLYNNVCDDKHSGS